jgi:chromosome segregation ATPase
MSKVAARKPIQAQQPASPRPLDLDHDLFRQDTAPCSGEATSLRNLLRVAGRRIEELGSVKTALGDLLEPMGRAFLALEAARDQARRLEAAKTAAEAEAEVQRGKAADLETRLAQQTSGLIAINENKLALKEKLTLATEQNLALEKALAGARDKRRAANDQNREQTLRADELAIERDALRARVLELEGKLQAREAEMKVVDQARTLYSDRNASLTRALTAKEAVSTQAARAIEELVAALHREKWQRAQAEEALKAAHRDYAIAVRGVMGLKRPADPAISPARIANAA